MEIDVYFRFLLALLLVLALIAALAWAARRFRLGGQLTPNAGKAARLSIIEVKTLDARRKLVLVRRDEREHLVLLGPSHDLLLESGIAARPVAQPEAPGQPIAASPPDVAAAGATRRNA